MGPGALMDRRTVAASISPDGIERHRLPATRDDRRPCPERVGIVAAIKKSISFTCYAGTEGRAIQWLQHRERSRRSLHRQVSLLEGCEGGEMSGRSSGSRTRSKGVAASGAAWATESADGASKTRKQISASGR